MSPEYTPMSEANTDRITVTATLPFHLEKRIGLNTKYIHTLLQSGRIKDVKITSDQDGETSKAVTQIVGMGRDGSALAGKTKTNTIPTSNYNLDPKNNFYLKQGSWPSLDIIMNVSEMKQRFLQFGEKVTDPKTWQKGIDQSIREAIIKSGTKHLTSGLTRSEKFGSSGILFAYSVGIVGFAYNQNLNTLAWASILATVTYLNEAMELGLEKPGSGLRFNLFMGKEIDRALALNVYGRLKPIAKSLSK